MRETVSTVDRGAGADSALLAAIAFIVMSAVAVHPMVFSVLLSQTPPIWTLALPVFVGALSYVFLVRPAQRRQWAARDELLAERDGARSRETRLKDEFEVSELALEKAEAARTKAERSAAAKAGYLSAISQEVRGPLSGVIGVADLMSETTLDGEQEAMVETLRQSADDLQLILSGVLDFSALEVGELTLEDVPFDIRDVAEKVVMSEVPAARKKGIELVIDAPPNLLTQARGDATRVEQMIRVLVSNAVKFTERGEVVVGLRSLERPSGAEMNVTVKDSGIGISESEIGQVFKPFHRAVAPSARRYGGIGLGLAIASKLAELMEGRLEAASTFGQGSLFTLRFAHRLRQTARGATKTGPDLSGQRFLLIEDCAPAADVLARQLKTWGADVVHAPGLEEGEDALWKSVAAGPEFTAVFLDTSLPGIDGIALASVIAEKLDQLPLVLMAPGDPRGAKNAVKEGVGVAVLEKPFLTAGLETVLARVAEARLDQMADASELEERARRAPSRPLGPVLQPGCIVLADDNATNRTLIEKFLADEPMTLIHAPDGIGAVEAFANWAPDLILMDVSMPRMDGLEATRSIREKERSQGLARVPIIALTARAASGDRTKCLDAGMDDYVTKPVRKNELKAKITEWIEARRMTA